MLGLSSGLMHERFMGKTVLAEYSSTFSFSNSQDGWVGWSVNTANAVITLGTGLSFNGSSPYTLITFLSTQTSDAGFIHNLYSTGGQSGDYLEISYEITVGAADDKWEAGDGSNIIIYTQFGGVESSSSIPITNHTSGTTTVTKTLTATSSYSGNDGRILLLFKASDNNLPQATASVTLRNINATLYRD